MQPLKASSGTAVIVEGRSAVVNDEQPRKQPCPNVESEVAKWKDCNCEQFSKAYASIVEIELETFTVVSDWQLRNALVSMIETFPGMVIEVMLV